MGRRASLAMTFGLLVACTASGTHSVPRQPGQTPDRVAGRTFCTLVSPVTASDGFYFPPRYPSEAIPDADRCFRSTSAARRTGLRPAPPPPGSTLIAGIYLMPTGSATAATCSRAARRAEFAVACPGVAPAPVDALEGPYAGPDFLLQEEFAGPPSYVGMGRMGSGGLSIGHLWVASSAIRISARSICFADRAEVPRDPSRTSKFRPTSVRGRPAAFVSCPEGSSTHSGHVVLFWHEAGAWHLVSLHGHTEVNERLDRVIATTSEMIGP